MGMSKTARPAGGRGHAPPSAVVENMLSVTTIRQTVPDSFDFSLGNILRQWRTWGDQTLSDLLQNVTTANSTLNALQNLTTASNSTLNDLALKIVTTADNSPLGRQGLEQLTGRQLPLGSYLSWDQTKPCPNGYLCEEIAGLSLGAFSCDELARIASKDFGFGDILAGIWCPERVANLRNCPRGYYCPDSKTKIICPAGLFCGAKTSAPTEFGGARTCNKCDAGADDPQLSKGELILQVTIFIVLVLLFVATWVRRKIKFNIYQFKMNFDEGNRSEELQAIKRDKEKYSLLKPKLEVIAERLDKLRAGDILFDANAFFDVLDRNGDGQLSFEEINTILCLNQEQLELFVENMRKRSHVRRMDNRVSRATFDRGFLAALAEASQLGPTAEEVADLFDNISEGEELIQYAKLYQSSLSSFLSDLQIYGLVTRFKSKQIKPRRRDSVRAKLSVGNSAIQDSEGISRELFIDFYPAFLSEVIHDELGARKDGIDGLDVAFDRLTLTVSVGKLEKKVVNGVNGRLRPSTMTAVMGGSGSGKSSLLNALCGRAGYGKVTGDIKINGNNTTIDEHKNVIGFVPQDDIVYPDLSVRENLLYAGRLYLPRGTSESEIDSLADETMAQLGLSRIADSLVGDARRRGVSGGEKKVAQTLLIMIPKPTSGLDSRSAFVVMEGLKRLCTQGMTVTTVIHQPRTDIYDFFDNLFLLGVGGCTVYSGPATEARSYFERLGYVMPRGESQADLFLDIASGDMEPDNVNDEEVAMNSNDALDGDHDNDTLLSYNDDALVKAQARREKLYHQWEDHYKNIPKGTLAELYLPPEPFSLPDSPTRVSGMRQFIIQLRRNSLLSRRNVQSRLFDMTIVIMGVFLITLLAKPKASNWARNPPAFLWLKFITSKEDAVRLFQSIFLFAQIGVTNIQLYGMMVGLVLAVLVGLNGTKIITDKRLEFFREASSGASVSAYYVAANFTTTFEQGVAAIISACLAYVLVLPSSDILVYIWNFWMVSWLSTSWSLLLTIITPAANVTTVQAPGTLNNMYNNDALALFAAFFSPLRPYQTGLTIDPSASSFPEFIRQYPVSYFGLGMTNRDVAITKGCDGYYYWVSWVVECEWTL
ncbi:hypothetical protein THAOC_02585 [Thalassiosira oceanica]|uniref:Uncharacterized protein n=1 Tax=Thalassiosira oceanica TaxID=159749 RepID=K0TLX7_THAOC|nr:hypothetical protein THAOC_02585 [Thalassiosira oceanica]|eukprot:EJK75686.1 hypothetical protein THAOC_02585 [Thalassiosira oceanica]